MTYLPFWAGGQVDQVTVLTDMASVHHMWLAYTTLPYGKERLYTLEY